MTGVELIMVCLGAGAALGIVVIGFMLPFFVLWIVWEIFLGLFTDGDSE